MINTSTFLYQDLPFILFFTSLNLFIPGILNVYFKNKKIELKENSKIEWTNRIISTINAIITTSLSLYCIVTNDSWVINPFTSTSYSSYLISKFISYYFLYDTIVSFVHYKILFTFGTLIHHIIGFLSFTILSGYYGLAHSLVILYSFSEITTPFINFRFFLLDLKLKSHPLYTINGLIVLFGFILVRDLYVPISIYNHITNPIYSNEIPYLISIFFKTIYPAITILNIYWTFQILKGVLKFFFKSTNESNNKKKAA